MPGPYYRRAATVIDAELGDEMLALHPSSRAFFEFNPVAASVWHYLEQPISYDRLRDQLLAEYAIDREQCSRDLSDLLADMVEVGLVEILSSRPPRQARAAAQSRASRADAHGGNATITLPAEFLAVVQCCRWNFRGAPEHSQPPEMHSMDWARFLRIARFHRVQGLTWHCLTKSDSSVPPETAHALAADAAQIAAANLSVAATSRDLLAMFDAAGLPLLFLKGSTLGALAYRNSAAKAAVDIDLLVPSERIAQAAQLLGSTGYELTSPGATGRLSNPVQWHRSRKESDWMKADCAIKIDLHTRLSDNPRLLPGVGIHSERQTVDLGNEIRLPTLAPDELFAYLAVHGASSAWFRLKWVSDFAGLLVNEPPAEIERLYRRSQQLGAGRAAGQALLVADALFGSLVALATLREELERDRTTRLLRDLALRQLAGRGEPAEPTERLGGTLAIHASQFLLLPGMAFKLSELARQLRVALPFAS